MRILGTILKILIFLLIASIVGLGFGVSIMEFVESF